MVSADFRRDASILDISGVPHKTTIYNLEVLNKLDMCRDKDKVVFRPSDLTSNDLLDVKNREYTLISESGLYRILAKCSLPKCCSISLNEKS